MSDRYFFSEVIFIMRPQREPTIFIPFDHFFLLEETDTQIITYIFTIFSSNLDEFFMVRIAGITSQLDTKFHRIYKEYGYEPAELLAELDRRIKELVARQYRYLNNDILPELRKHKITIASWDSLTTLQKNTALKIMTTEIYPGKGPGCEYVGHIVYLEKVYECTGKTISEAKTGTFTTPKARRIRELTRYDGKKWIY